MVESMPLERSNVGLLILIDFVDPETPLMNSPSELGPNHAAKSLTTNKG